MAEHERRENSRLLEVAYQLGHSPTANDPVPASAVEALRELIPCPDAVYFEWDGSRMLTVASSELRIPPAVQSAMRALGPERPTAAARLTPGAGAVRLSARTSRRHLSKLAFFEEVMRPLGIEDELTVRLPLPNVSAGISLVRDRRFLEREQRLLELLAPFFSRARTRAAGPTNDAKLTAREREVLAWVERGKTNKEIAGLLGVTPHTVRKHLERIFEKLGVHTRTAAVARVFGTGTRAAPR